MNPYMLKEEIGCGLIYDIILVGYQNGHLRELINNHKNAVVSILGG